MRSIAVRRAGALRRLLGKILDLVLENEKIRRILSCEPNKGVVVIFNNTAHDFAVGEMDAHRRRLVDQLLQITDFLKSLLGRPCARFTVLCRSYFSW